MDIPVVKFEFVEGDNKKYLDSGQFQIDLDMAILDVHLDDRDYTVFQQNAGEDLFGQWGDYMNSHGCACCSLTTILSAWNEDMRYLMPEDTASRIERLVFGDTLWKMNYEKPLKKQMPVSMAGIAQILDHYDIPNTRCRRLSHHAIIQHLHKGKPVVVETSRIRHSMGLPVSIRDRKFAGSYHTMIILGVEPDDETIWLADSATRDWAGHMQRIKRVSLRDLLAYTFPCRDMGDVHPYFTTRKSSGGMILVG